MIAENEDNRPRLSSDIQTKKYVEYLGVKFYMFPVVMSLARFRSAKTYLNHIPEDVLSDPAMEFFNDILSFIVKPSDENLDILVDKWYGKEKFQELRHTVVNGLPDYTKGSSETSEQS